MAARATNRRPCPRNGRYYSTTEGDHFSNRREARLTRKHGIKLRQSYSRVAKSPAMMAGRCAHAKQFKRRQRQLRLLRSRLGRIIDIRRKTDGQPVLEEAFAPRSAGPIRSALSSSASAAGSLIPSMPRRWSASARARQQRPTSSGSRPPSQPTTGPSPAASLYCTPDRCPTILTTATPCGASLKMPNGSRGARSSAPTPTRDIVATPTTHAASSSPVRSEGPRRHQARAAPPFSHRTRQRTPQVRRPYRSLLSQRPRWRCRKRHPLRRRLQFPPHLQPG